MLQYAQNSTNRTLNIRTVCTLILNEKVLYITEQSGALNLHPNPCPVCPKELCSAQFQQQQKKCVARFAILVYLMLA